jgi:hypothetical protein
MRAERLAGWLGGVGVGLVAWGLWRQRGLLARAGGTSGGTAGERTRGASVPGNLEDLGSPSAAPMESWRGSGLAEDIGVPPHDSGALSDAERQARMREAEERLGLPHRS